MVGNSPTVKLVFCFFDVVGAFFFLISLAGGFVEHFLLNTFFSETGDQDLGLDLFDMFFFLQIFPDGRSRVMRVVLC